MLDILGRLVADRGVLVVTTVDAISAFPETLRLLIGQLIIRGIESFNHQIEKLVPVMSPHLSTLAGMSRSHRDWVVDNVLNPAAITFFDLLDVLETIGGSFELYGSSP